MEDWQRIQAVRIAKTAKFLLSRADERGMTHGEKHHYHEVIGNLLSEIIDCLGGEQSTLDRNLSTDAPSEIPF